jgi:hypothetical protein
LDGFEAGVEIDSIIPEELESSIQGSTLEGCGSVCGDHGETHQSTLGTDVKLKCTSFDWISS